MLRVLYGLFGTRLAEIVLGYFLFSHTGTASRERVRLISGGGGDTVGCHPSNETRCWGVRSLDTGLFFSLCLRRFSGAHAAQLRV